MTSVKDENFKNVKGRREILLFIGSRIWHLKQHNQSENDTWHIPRRGKSTRLVTNKVMTCGTTFNNQCESTSKEQL